MSMEPSRAASSRICSLDNILPSLDRPAQERVCGVAERLGKLWTRQLTTLAGRRLIVQAGEGSLERWVPSVDMLKCSKLCSIKFATRPQTCRG